MKTGFLVFGSINCDFAEQHLALLGVKQNLDGDTPSTKFVLFTAHASVSGLSAHQGYLRKS